ncbi:MAG: UDP-glucose 4-epimerase GalE, partial [bacterium]|nr:UDP-glucose 4-epimerase GalE [bacterium]
MIAARKKKETTNRVLVTGGAGYVGSACVKALCDSGYRVTAFDNLANGEKKYVDERATFVAGDVRDENALQKVFKALSPDTVIHAAALKAVGESEEQPGYYFTNNVSGTLNVLKAASEHGVEHFIFSSTAAVYRPSGSGIYKESDPSRAISVYGNSKIMAETLITEFARTGKIPAYTIFRYFNVAGDIGLHFIEKNPQNLFPLLARSFSDDAAFNVFGNDYATPDGTCVRDYIHVGDVADAHVRAISDGKTGVFNLGIGKGYSVLELIALFGEAAGKDVSYTFAERRRGD